MADLAPTNAATFRSGNDRVWLVRLDAKILDGFVEDGPLDLSIQEKFMERSERDEAGINLEEVTQRSASVAAAEAIRAEGGQAARHPFADHIGQRLQVIGSRDEDARRFRRKTFRDVRDVLLFARMQD